MDKAVESVVAKSVPTALDADLVGDALTSLAGRQFDSSEFVYVLDQKGQLCGRVRVTDLLAMSAQAHLSEATLVQLPSVCGDMVVEQAANFAVNHKTSDLPAVDAGGRFIGVMPATAIAEALHLGHQEDIHQSAGIILDSEAAITALESSPFLRARYRLPWLMVGLLGSMLATRLMANFEATISAQITIAFFIPGIIYLADAVGTQSEAVTVRRLSFSNFNIFTLLLGELATGILIGAVLALIAGCFTMVYFGQPSLAGAVALSLLCACSIATTIGLVLPWLFSLTGSDPALASGPLATIVQDVLSLVIYLSIATQVVTATV